MKMDLVAADWLQRNLIIMATDDLSALSVAYGEREDRQQWQFSVDMIYRLLVCRLISVSSPLEDGLEAIREFSVKLSQVDPFDRSPGNFEAVGVWIEPLLTCSYPGSLLVAKYGFMHADAAEDLAKHWRDAAIDRPDAFPTNDLADADCALRHASQLFECAAISRAAGWQKSSEWPPLNVAFIEEIEAVFDRHNVPWSNEPLIPIRLA